jgi:hypothetical protein
MRASYGVPYKGSKNFIAPWIIEMIPPAENFYDLFAGGCAITHCAMLSGKWNNFVCNDLDGGGINLFIDAINGKFKNERRWISRDDFFRFKDKDPFVKFCWSFGNNGKSYLYGRAVEKEKKKMHDYAFGDDSVFPNAVTDSKSPCDRMLFLKHYLIQNNKHSLPKGLEILQRLQRLESLERLKSLQSLESLQSLQSLQNIEMYKSDYRDVKIRPDSVVYCDIPYKGTSKYFNDFNYEDFYDWAIEKKEPIYISEYQMPERFHLISKKIKQCRFNSNNKVTVENLYSNDAGFKLLNAGILL